MSLVKVKGPLNPTYSQSVLTPDALAFLHKLHQKFNPRRLELLEARRKRQISINNGELPDFLASTKSVREGSWTIAPIRSDLENRQVEITGPADAKMMINALNANVNSFMADLEDALSPTWENVIEGQINIQNAVRRTLEFNDSSKAKTYSLNPKIATLIVRPRGFHLDEKHLTVGDEPMSGSLVDFGLYFFHNAAERLEQGSGPYLYLPKLESHLEARLWNDVFVFAQNELGIPQGSVKATVLIETILAAFEMDEILYELREHSSGLNAGRWDYIFSIIKKFRNHADKILPDRSQVTMTSPFMKSYAELLVKTCHKRGAHAMGGMAAFIPSRHDQAVNEAAVAKVRADKKREAEAGFDGTWIAHPDLADVAREQFALVLKGRLNQKDRQREDVSASQRDLLNLEIPQGSVTVEGIKTNIRVAIQYIDHWLKGQGAVALYNLMEDAATAEISRAQLWQWLHTKAKIQDGPVFDSAYYNELRNTELAILRRDNPSAYSAAADLLDTLVLQKEFCEFLTLPAYERLA